MTRREILLLHLCVLARRGLLVEAREQVPEKHDTGLERRVLASKGRGLMKRKVMIVGIGPGDPDCVTIQAIKAMNRVDVFFMPDKGAEKADLGRFRRSIIDRYVRDRPFRTVEYRVPSRRRDGDSYEGAVATWHAEIGDIYGQLILEHLSESEVGAFLVWGDPTLYDSTLRIVERLRAKGGFEFDYDVIAGVSSVQALAARHRVPINEIGRPVLITNGRGLAEGLPANADSAVVLLNADKALRGTDGELDAYWGAYVGMPQESLVSGKLKDIVDEVERVRSAARREHGWIMDCLLLKTPRERSSPHSPTPRERPARKRRT
jgi:precorrin-6A synthase